MILQSLDIVRVIGNESVHPGVIDLKDDRHTALRLFRACFHLKRLRRVEYLAA